MNQPIPNWIDAARAQARSAALGPLVREHGRVEWVADGIARVSGLPQARLGERLSFEAGQQGLALTLERDTIGCVLLDLEGREGRPVQAGDRVFATGEVLRVPVGDALLGRVVDALGRPIDGGAPIAADAHLPVEREAPAIIERDAVTEPVHTGLLVVDALFALGRGQRELIIGDPATGKTALAVDAMIAQKDTDIVCVYVAVGQKTAAVRRVIDEIRRHGAPERCVFVVAGASDPAGLQWIAPFAGFSIAEHFRDSGRHALVVVDDLTKHAATHREIALLTRQPVGREAYPGDVFYLHARLLERAAHVNAAYVERMTAGAVRGRTGSLTALPIAETEAGNLSAYIPTNLISITDGQLVLDARLAQKGQLPAVDVGRSVSRVGGKTQRPALRDAAGPMRLDYAQFLELEAFTRFGGISDAKVLDRLARGDRLRALLVQPQFAPAPLALQVALLRAVRAGRLDVLPVARIAQARARLAAEVERLGRAVADALEAGGRPAPEVLARLDAAAAKACDETAASAAAASATVPSRAGPSVTAASVTVGTVTAAAAPAAAAEEIAS